MQLKKTEVIYCKVNTAIAKARWALYKIPKIKYLRHLSLAVMVNFIQPLKSNYFR
jgi:hypothetical protein